MADYLTFENDSSLTIKVNGNTVSSGYELQDGDVITVSMRGVEGEGITINNTDNYTNTTNNIGIYNKSIYITHYFGSVSGGGSVK